MAATLQRKYSGQIIFVIITKIITKENVPKDYFVMISARMVNRFGGLSRDWVGGKFTYFFGVIPYGGEKAHKQNPQQISGQSPENFVYEFFVLRLFCPPRPDF